MATDALSVSELDVCYGQSQVVHRLSMNLQEGRVLALLGRNGAGKSTSLNTFAGLHQARAGSIRLAGRPVERMSPEGIARAGMRLVPQGRRIFPSLTVLENLQVAEQAARANDDGKHAWNLERVYATFGRLKERMRQRAGTLSGGEQQMLAIGRALMGNPRVLLLDEPSEGLAPLIVAEVAQAIKTLKADRLSIVLVEQNFNLALEVADDVVVLNTGHVVHAGSADAVRAEPELATRHLGVF
ncbi:ABC transporter ATP-binding protein [Variovorax sp. J31P207]|uniref:ABC transporter ATP-binding protein n=1 Tax=Variovorax sp. J31P207 TaxID=3053510 RepID=UPI00257576BD|nr:ABC transporter ATP-binding protein [Variovorax sp. J31P207]MDM0066038.1 ABC transporter ATP-binding protein [Variovorax sp. J31P207]